MTVTVMIMAVFFTCWSFAYPEDAYPALYAGGAELWSTHRFWLLITSTFLHGDYIHILFNLSWIWQFGRFIEAELGPGRYTFFVLFTAWISAVTQLSWVGEPGIGLSGVVYAMFGYILIRRREIPAYRGLVATQTVWLFAGWFVLCVVLTRAGSWHIANAAHAGGWIVGMLLGGMVNRGKWRLGAKLGLLISTVASVVVLFWAPWLQEWQMARAYQLAEKGSSTELARTMDQLLSRYPDDEWTLQLAVWTYATQGEFEREQECQERLLRIKPTPENYNNLAWLLATSPVDAVRDGEKAVRLARKACELTDWNNASYLNTYAAALAEKGDFAEAVKISADSIAKAGEDAAMYQPYDDAFRAGKPWREMTAP